MSDKSSGSFWSRPSTVFSGIILFVILCWTAWLMFIPSKYPGKETKFDNAGQFGDMFGALNTLFTGFAFAGLIYTIILQREEITYSKKVNEHQQLESTFFQLLNLLNDTIRQIECADIELIQKPDGLYSTSKTNSDKAPVILKGRSAFELYAKVLIELLKSAEFGGLNRHDTIKKAHEILFSKYGDSLARYYRIIFRILRWLDDSNIEQKSFYVKVLRAQLSNQELTLIFYNSFTEEGKDMRNFIVNYALLKHCPLQSLAREEDENMYPTTAYGRDYYVCDIPIKSTDDNKS